MSDSIKLKKIFEMVNEDSCPDKYNFHCHSTYSDGSLKPQEIIYQAFNNKLIHLAVTDHHNIEAYLLMKNWIDENSWKFTFKTNIWTGLEISCLLNKCLVHVLAYGFDIKAKSIFKYIQNESQIGQDLHISNVIKAINDAGGISILAHPARYRLNYKELILSAADYGIDGAEAWYDYKFRNNWTATPLICKRIDQLLKSINLLSTCGTDTHGFSIKKR
tara:strand:- start:380 stop:1033 length:654 start_codon:yes stop_codon:yes gene_type:complete